MISVSQQYFTHIVVVGFNVKGNPVLNGKRNPVLNRKRNPVLNGKGNPVLNGKGNPVLKSLKKSNHIKLYLAICLICTHNGPHLDYD